MANALQLWDPARELEGVRRDFDNLFGRFFSGQPRWMQRFSAMIEEPRIESYVDNDKLVVRAEMPGMDPKDLEVTVSGNMLTIRGTREERHEKKDRDFLHQEISYGRMERSIALPPGTTGEGIKAAYRNGILELTVPIPKELSTRKVPVQVEQNGGGATEAKQIGGAEAKQSAGATEAKQNKQQ
jgi:HSP20 family protein